MIKYDLKDIIIFTYVAKLKSFTRAAETLYISRTVASSRVRELEQDVGMDLLARTTREVNLTNDGVIFLEYCNSILNKIDNLENFIEQYNKEISETLTVALPPYFSRNYIVPHLEEFLEQYPNLKLYITLTEDPINIIEEICDIQIRIQIPEEEDLEVVKLMNNEKIVCTSPGYIEKNGRPNCPEDLLNYNCIVFGENKVWRFRNKANNEITELHDMEGNIKCNNGEIIKSLVLSGVGITLKSAIDVREEIKKKEIVVLLEDYEVITETKFYAVYQKRTHMPLRIKAFIDFFKEKLS